MNWIEDSCGESSNKARRVCDRVGKKTIFHSENNHFCSRIIFFSLIGSLCFYQLDDIIFFSCCNTFKPVIINCLYIKSEQIFLQTPEEFVLNLLTQIPWSLSLIQSLLLSENLHVELHFSFFHLSQYILVSTPWRKRLIRECSCSLQQSCNRAIKGVRAVELTDN